MYIVLRYWKKVRTTFIELIHDVIYSFVT